MHLYSIPTNVQANRLTNIEANPTPPPSTTPGPKMDYTYATGHFHGFAVDNVHVFRCLGEAARLHLLFPWFWRRERVNDNDLFCICHSTGSNANRWPNGRNGMWETGLWRGIFIDSKVDSDLCLDCAKRLLKRFSSHTWHFIPTREIIFLAGSFEFAPINISSRHARIRVSADSCFVDSCFVKTFRFSFNWPLREWEDY